jgi:hypothetical protein
MISTNHLAKLCLPGLGLSLGLSLASSAALASPAFPDVTRDYLDLGCTPQCTICHTDNFGGYGTATRPFGETLLDLDVVGTDDDSLRQALEELAAAEGNPQNGGQGAAGAPASGSADDTGTDSDKDGVDDIAELVLLRDPSIPGVGDMCKPNVLYGCGARVEPRSNLGLPGVLAVGVVALFGALLRRRWVRSASR